MFSSRWNPCVAHAKSETERFVQEYFSLSEVTACLIAGAGFDPRARVVSNALAQTPGDLRCVLIKEHRPSPDQTQVSQADDNSLAMLSCFQHVNFIDVDIFGDDGAVVGGRNTINQLHNIDFSEVSDIVIDMSALSVGTSFPIIKYFVQRYHQGKGPQNVHVFVTHDPSLDDNIQAITSDEAGYIHGFKGQLTLQSSAEKARMWLPQLALGRNQSLERVHRFLKPDDTCPIVPFPASDPRSADQLFWAYKTEIESAWDVSTRNIVYANEDDPVDLYRTILRLDDLRQPVFEASGGSHVILSPIGSKLMALGALMAALERDLPVAYVEAVDYNLGASACQTVIENPDMYHVWLEGSAYPTGRPKIRSIGEA